MSEDRDASYPDLGLVMDSKEGGLEESEEVEDRVGERGQELLLSGHMLGCCLWVRTPLAISSPNGLHIPIVLVRVFTGHGVVYSPWSMPWLPILFSHYFQSNPLLCSSKYQLICSFLFQFPSPN